MYILYSWPFHTLRYQCRPAAHGVQHDATMDSSSHANWNLCKHYCIQLTWGSLRWLSVVLVLHVWSCRHTAAAGAHVCR